MLVLRNLFFDYLNLVSPISVSNCDSHALYFIFLQVLPPFMGKGNTSHISSWYKALTDDTKALVHDVGLKPINWLLPKSFTSSILVQTLVERWLDITHTFHIADWEMIVTPHNFH